MQGLVAAAFADDPWFGGEPGRVDLVVAGEGVYRQDPVTPPVDRRRDRRRSRGCAAGHTRVPVLSRILADTGTLVRLAIPHTVRIAGAAFLLVWALGKLPAVFALPAGLGDLAVGVAALFVAHRLASGGHRAGAVWFNILGLVDLVVAIGIGSLAAAGPHRLLAVAPSTEAIALLPLAVIPTTAVPLAAALHVLSLRPLRTAPPAARRVAAVSC